MSEQLVEVAVLTAAPGRYTYKLPAPLVGRVHVGTRVLVKFGGKKLTGVVVRVNTPAPKDVVPIYVSEVLDHDEPALTPDLVELCLWMAEYYEAMPGEAFRGALPAGSSISARAVWTLTEAGQASVEGRGGALPAKQRALLAKLGQGDLPTSSATAAQRTLLEAMSSAGLVEVLDLKSQRTKLRREKVVRIVGDLARAHADARRAPKRTKVIEGLASAFGHSLAPPNNQDAAAAQPVAGSDVSAETLREAATSVVDVDASSESGDDEGSDGEEAEDEFEEELDTDTDDPLDVVPLAVLERRMKGCSPMLRELAKLGVVEITEREAELEAIAIGAAMHAGPPPTLTGEQAHAVGELVTALEAGTFKPFLLFGVTGSGKTEVYLRLIARALEVGKSALVLVPEISLTPQLAARFRARFGDQVAILHSGLAEQARLGEWSRLRRGEATIAVGARSAVFAPLARLGVIVVDEEHDGSFKQDEGVKYHARDVALVRAQRAGAVCVLGSGTPSLESNALAEKGVYGKLVLTQRPMARPMPSVEIIDLRMYQADGEAMLSAPLRAAITETLAAGDQIILFLNRRGFATFVLCAACGHAFRCPNCSVSLTYHRSLDRATCHYCSYTERIPDACPKCQVRAIERKGLGTEKIAAAVAEAFPAARVGRLDRDVASGARVEAVLSRVARRELDILVGTQMVTKGHDFPGVTLVGVLCADTGLNLPDFRASERTFQLLAQVAGRAGRGDKPGRVIIQTYRPEAPAVVAAAAHDYAQFYAAEVEERRDRSYPPHGRMIVVRVDGADEHAVADVATRIAQMCEHTASRLAEGGTPVEVLGPVAAPLSRLRGRSRWQVWLRAAERGALRKVARAALGVEHLSAIRVSLDVDPNSAM